MSPRSACKGTFHHFHTLSVHNSILASPRIPSFSVVYQTPTILKFHHCLLGHVMYFRRGYDYVQIFAFSRFVIVFFDSGECVCCVDRSVAQFL